jgi:hypothetical protein
MLLEKSFQPATKKSDLHVSLLDNRRQATDAPDSGYATSSPALSISPSSVSLSSYLALKERQQFSSDEQQLSSSQAPALAVTRIRQLILISSTLMLIISWIMIGWRLLRTLAVAATSSSDDESGTDGLFSSISGDRAFSFFLFILCLSVLSSAFGVVILPFFINAYIKTEFQPVGYHPSITSTIANWVHAIPLPWSTPDAADGGWFETVSKTAVPLIWAVTYWLSFFTRWIALLILVFKPFCHFCVILPHDPLPPQEMHENCFALDLLFSSSGGWLAWLIILISSWLITSDLVGETADNVINVMIVINPFYESNGKYSPSIDSDLYVTGNIDAIIHRNVSSVVIGSSGDYMSAVGRRYGEGYDIDASVDSAFSRLQAMSVDYVSAIESPATTRKSRGHEISPMRNSRENISSFSPMVVSLRTAKVTPAAPIVVDGSEAEKSISDLSSGDPDSSLLSSNENDDAGSSPKSRGHQRLLSKWMSREPSSPRTGPELYDQITETEIQDIQSLKCDPEIQQLLISAKVGDDSSNLPPVTNADQWTDFDWFRLSCASDGNVGVARETLVTHIE